LRRIGRDVLDAELGQGATEQIMSFELEKAAVRCVREREATDTTNGPWANYP
jgi:hypothetical protein